MQCEKKDQGQPFIEDVQCGCRLFWSMPNLACMFMGGLQAQQLPEKQQQGQSVQQPFSFPQTNMRAVGGYSWGLKPFQNPCQPRAPSPSPLALLAAAAQLTGCSA